MRGPQGILVALALAGTAAAGGFDPARPGGPGNTAAAVRPAVIGADEPRATFDDLATELAWLEGDVLIRHVGFMSRRCDRRRRSDQMLRQLDRQLDRLTAELEGRRTRGFPAEPPPPPEPPPPASWLGDSDP